MRLNTYLLIVGVAMSSAFSLPVTAQTAPSQSVTGSLVTLINSGQYTYNRLERLAAIANQAAYNRLSTICDARATAPTATCPAASLAVFSNVRELVHSANELLGSGPTEFSLSLDNQGVGFALRWTAAEELSAPGSVSKEFANAQIASVMSRITALRFGASGFAIAGAPLSQNNLERVAENNRRGGGAAGSDAIDGEIMLSRWGGFIDGSFTWGTRAPSDLEDAFAFDGDELTLGVDYRFNSQLVLGGMIGYSKQRIDFDSVQSVVDGGIESQGLSLMIYGLQQWDGPYLSGAIGVQRLGHDTKRDITYPSFNINVESVYATAYGYTKSTSFNGTLELGWSFTRRAFAFEPSLSTHYQSSRVDAFAEYSVHNYGNSNGAPAGFDFNVGAQSMATLDTSVGAKCQYAFTPTFGVIVPYLRAEYHRTIDTSPFTVSSTYNGIGNSDAFALPSEQRDRDYFVYAVGSSMVLKHGWQGFLQYQTVSGLRLIENHVLTAGIRAEF